MLPHEQGRTWHSRAWIATSRATKRESSCGREPLARVQEQRPARRRHEDQRQSVRGEPRLHLRARLRGERKPDLQLAGPGGRRERDLGGGERELAAIAAAVRAG